jgi:tRNA (cytidine/uridine-2'-O-)-methyltransferase
MGGPVATNQALISLDLELAPGTAPAFFGSLMSAAPEPLLHVALFEPLIPQNTGNIGRLTTANGLALHLIEPLGFSLDEKKVRRAGLDYWRHVDLRLHKDWQDFRAALRGRRIFAFSKRGATLYSEAGFRPGDVLLFGKETKGLPAEVLDDEGVLGLRLPMRSPLVRSLNLANAVAIGVYEALRQLGFPDSLAPDGLENDGREIDGLAIDGLESDAIDPAAPRHSALEDL